MPKELEEKLKQKALQLGYRPGSKEFNAYVYGTMRRLGWRPKREKKKERAKRLNKESKDKLLAIEVGE